MAIFVFHNLLSYYILIIILSATTSPPLHKNHRFFSYGRFWLLHLIHLSGKQQSQIWTLSCFSVVTGSLVIVVLIIAYHDSLAFCTCLYKHQTISNLKFDYTIYWCTWLSTWCFSYHSITISIYCCSRGMIFLSTQK